MYSDTVKAEELNVEGSNVITFGMISIPLAKIYKGRPTDSYIVHS